MPESPFNDWDLTSLTSLPTSVLVAAACLLVGALALSTTSTRGAPLRLRAGLFLLRLLLCAAVFFVLLEPGRRLLATSKVPDRVVIAVDTSASMSVGEGNAQRIREAAIAAQDIVDDVAARGFVPELWFFDKEARKASLEEVQALASLNALADGPASILASVVDAAANSETTQVPTGGVVIISDGADTGGLTPGLTADLRQRIAALGSTGAPLHAVVVGADSNFRDVVLERAIADEFAFVRNPMKIEVVIRQRGFIGQVVPLTLSEDGAVVARTEVTLAGDGEEVRARFELTPQRAGKRLYTVQSPVLDGEAIAENNRLDFTVKLIRDRIRVLQVAGRPSWDERFVRRLLKENPSVDLISFFILRSTTDISGAGNNELSLIPFPTRELFTEQLHTFDVVIFQDFNYRPYQMGTYLKNVAEYVKQGGGLLMIGGDLTFSEGEYQNTPLADVLPIQMRAGRGHLDTETFTPVVTEAGQHHPITDVGDAVGVAPSAAGGLGTLPPLQGLNLVAGLAPNAVALLTHPFANADDGTPQPVIAVADVEKGRSVAVMTDTLWHWALPQLGSGGASNGGVDAHRKLIANTLRWLIRDPELSHVKLALATEGQRNGRGFEPGAEVLAEVRTFNTRYQPEGGAKLKLTLTPLEPGGTSKTIEGETGPDGTFCVPLLPDRAGAWRARVDVVGGDGGNLGSDEDVFVVRATSLERLYGEARPDLMAALAGAGGGRSVDVGAVKGLPFVDHGKVKVHRQKTEPLWNTWAALVVVTLLAATEWWWRRRRGFA
ncbi:MAG: glutamine amidotransferase [Deltaproteobacteria bacterium]|nr:glutamine amidotransferase [Deltaproteobacteria bacterium]